MRIGVDASCWANPRGYGRFTRNMLTALLAMDHENRYVFFMDSLAASATDLPETIEKKIIDLSESPTRAASADGRRSVKDMLKMGLAVSRERLDIFFYPSVYTYYPIFSSAKKIVAIHDVIAEKYPELIFKSRKNRFFWDAKTWLAVRQADLILTVSRFSQRGIAQHFGVPESEIRVVTEGSSDSFYPIEKKRGVAGKLLTRGLDESTRFILYVGGIAPHKNLSVLVRAFSRLMNEANYEKLKLVLVGDYKNDVFLMDESLKETLNRPAFRERVIFAGYVPDEELNLLYNAAEVFVLPSFCEGFGLPALEAMSCGTVVIGSSTTSVPEVVGDAGLFFDPASEQELTDCLRRVLNDDQLREKLGRRSLQRAATFSWEESASDMLQVIQDLGARPGI